MSNYILLYAITPAFTRNNVGAFQKCKIFSYYYVVCLYTQALNIYPKFAGANVFQSRELFPFVSRIKESERFGIYLPGNKPFLVILSHFAYERV